MRLEPHRLVFIDETGTTTKMTRLRGRCPIGQRLRARAPFGHWLTQTFIAGLRCHGLSAPWIVDAVVVAAIFAVEVMAMRIITPHDLMSLLRPELPGSALTLEAGG